MAKRGRGDILSLTGGTGDVNPNYLGMDVLLSAANTYTQASTAVPQLPAVVGQNSAIVMEIIWVEFDFGGFEHVNGNTEEVEIQVTNRSVAGALGQSHPGLIAKQNLSGGFLVEGGSIYPTVYKMDISDGAGHGYLFAGQTIYISATSFGLVAAATAYARVCYRFKRVSIQEYVGMMASLA